MKKTKLRKLIIFIASLALMLAGVLFMGSCLLDPSRVFREDDSWLGLDVDETFNRDRINIALLGFDRSEARDKKYSIYRPDTIMIASLDFKKKDVSLVNISRDSFVSIPGTGFHDKINHAYMHGYNRAGDADPHMSGIDLTLETIEEFLGGVPIHYFVSLDMDGVVEIVDQVGGVYYDVEHPIRADSGRGRLLLDEGYQLLDGRQFLNYVRSRNVGGDTGRSRRQQNILIETFAQLKKQGRLRDIPAVYSSVKDNVETNLSPVQIASLALFGLKVDPDTISSHIFQGSGQFKPQGDLNIFYIVIDEKARVELIMEVFAVTVEQRPQITLPGPRKPAAETPEQPAPPVEPAPPEEPGPGDNGDSKKGEENGDYDDENGNDDNGSGSGNGEANNGYNGGGEPDEDPDNNNP